MIMIIIFYRISVYSFLPLDSARAEGEKKNGFCDFRPTTAVGFVRYAYIIYSWVHSRKIDSEYRQCMLAR